MSSSHRIGMVVGLALLPGAAFAETLDVKTGMWETTTTLEHAGAPPVDLSQLSPERRARLEAALKKQEAEGAHKRTHVSKHCLTREELSREPFQEMERGLEKHGESCKSTVIAATSKRWQGKIACAGKTAITTEFSIEALSRENVKGSAKTHASDGAHTMHSSATFSARWLSAQCDKN